MWLWLSTTEHPLAAFSCQCAQAWKWVTPYPAACPRKCPLSGTTQPWSASELLLLLNGHIPFGQIQYVTTLPINYNEQTVLGHNIHCIFHRLDHCTCLFTVNLLQMGFFCKKRHLPFLYNECNNIPNQKMERETQTENKKRETFIWYSTSAFIPCMFALILFLLTSHCTLANTGKDQDWLTRKPFKKSWQSMSDWQRHRG